MKRYDVSLLPKNFFTGGSFYTKGGGEREEGSEEEEENNEEEEKSFTDALQRALSRAEKGASSSSSSSSSSLIDAAFQRGNEEIALIFSDGSKRIYDTRQKRILQEEESEASFQPWFRKLCGDG